MGPSGSQDEHQANGEENEEEQKLEAGLLENVHKCLETL